MLNYSNIKIIYTLKVNLFTASTFDGKSTPAKFLLVTNLDHEKTNESYIAPFIVPDFYNRSSGLEIDGHVHNN